MSALVVRGRAACLPLPDSSVDLIISSPPYWSLRSYQDNGAHYDGQIGSEDSPEEFIAALLDCTREWMRVLKPSGSLWINLGDKYGRGTRATATPQSNVRTGSVPAATPITGFDKSLMGLPWRYALGCIDQLGLILRAEVIWDKPNGLPESVTDRVRRSHEQWFHFVKQPRYFSAVDEIREPHTGGAHSSGAGQSRRWLTSNTGGNHRALDTDPSEYNPLGKLPGSVWTIPSEPLTVPDHLGVDHFAAFPTEWPRRIIQGWSPSGICVECGEPRRTVVASVGLDHSRPQARRAQEIADNAGLTEDHFQALLSVGISDTGRGAATQTGTGKNTAEVYALANEARTALGGYAREYLLRRPTSLKQVCACSERKGNALMPNTRPAVVLDPFGGTGTTALCASVLGRIGITVDLSHDYSRLAQWRTTDPASRAKAMRVEKPPVQLDGQAELFGAAS